MSTMNDNNSARLNIRISQHEKDVITQAAGTLNTTVSKFIIQKAFAEAEAILADKSEFSLSEKEWQEFCRALDQPPKNISKLRRLLTETGVFDE